MMHDVPIVYEDEFLLVLNKPSGLVVNRSQTTKEDTLQDYLDESDTPEIVDSTDELLNEFNSRSGIVHRLDKNTSGLLLIAKTPAIFQALQQQFKSREVAKEYDALVYGEITDEVFEINAPIGRNPRLRFKFAVVKDGKEAFTKFIKIKTCMVDKLTVTHLKCLPKTGRTHQIRVHLLAINHPIVGDDIYATQKQLDDTYGLFDRMMLHATSLEFTHPISGNRLSLTTELPQAFVC